MLSTQQVSSTQQATHSVDGWQSELAAIDGLERIDVPVVQQAAADSDDELSELRQAHEVILAKLMDAEQRSEVIDTQLSEVFQLVATVRQTLDTDSNFAAIYATDAELAIKHVRPLQHFAE